MFMKGKFDAYVLWPLAENFQNTTAHDFTVFADSKQDFARLFKDAFLVKIILVLWSLSHALSLAVTVRVTPLFYAAQFQQM